MTVEFQTEKLETVVDDAKELLFQHYQELTQYKSKIILKPIWEKYFDLEKNSKFFLFTARNNGELVGYSGFFLDSHIHYADTLVAVNDVLFLKKEFRQGLTGIRLLKYSEKEMAKLGADKISWHVKFSNDFRPILHRMGYLDEEVIVTKMI